MTYVPYSYSYSIHYSWVIRWESKELIERVNELVSEWLI